MSAVPPVTPVTTPEAFTVAFVLLLLHTPPEVAFANWVVVPILTVVFPLMADTIGLVLTVTAVIADVALHNAPLVTVTE